MKNLAWLWLVLTVACSSTPPKAAYPPPRDPKYVAQAAIPLIKENFPRPPEMNSPAQTEDEKELFRIQKGRSAEECEKASHEVEANLKNLFGAPEGPLNDVQVEKLDAFFKEIRRDGGYFIGALKDQMGRLRPYSYISGLQPCVKKENSMAYPSGHATIGQLYGLVLSDLLPKDKKKIMAQAKLIGDNRVVAGVHHPSDIVAGRELAQRIYNEMKKSPKFQADMESARLALKQ